MDSDREAAIVAAMKRLDPKRDFTTTGVPEVDALNDYMPEGSKRVTATERDRVWASVDATFSVRATRPGFLRVYRDVGDTFMVTGREFSETWMERA